MQFLMALVVGMLFLMHNEQFRTNTGLGGGNQENALVCALFGLAFMNFRLQSQQVAAKPVTEKDIKALIPKVEKNYKMKLSFFALCTPDEILKGLVDTKARAIWDYNSYNISHNQEANTLRVSYKSQDPLLPDYFEEISFKYFIDGPRFVIIEYVNSPTLAKSERVYILEQVQNRPYFMRIVFYWTLTPQYHRVKLNGRFVVKSIAALKNLVHQSDRETEIPVNITQGTERYEED